MRQKIVAGNWKMNKNFQEGIELAMAVQERLKDYTGDCLSILIPPYIHLAKIRELLTREGLHLGAQDCSAKAQGAYTGEVSAEMLWSAGADYVIVGHSERRQYHGETSQLCAQKINAALDNQLQAIYCVGENREEREAGRHFEVIGRQIAEGLFGLEASDMSQVIVAYEPVWAIGTGLTATKEQAQEVHAYIRGQVAGKFGAEVAQELSILYGGSCKPSNAAELFAQPDVDGGLIGGAALEADDFVRIIEANR